MITYVDGDYVDHTQAVIPAHDLAVLRGYGVFDVVRAYDGYLFRIRDHIKRLIRSAGMIGIPVRHSDDELIHICQETMTRNDLGDAIVRIVLTGGDGIDSITPAGNPRLLVFASAYTPPAPEVYARGVSVITTSHQRFLPYAKTIHYIPAILAVQEARHQHAEEAIYVDSSGAVSEGTRTSIFMFKNNVLITPREEILPGITRQVVLELAHSEFEVQERNVMISELLRADEAFLTSTTREVMPISRIDEVPIDVGGNTQRLMALFTNLVASERLQTS